jgi:hypothetical protein
MSGTQFGEATELWPAFYRTGKKVRWVWRKPKGKRDDLAPVVMAGFAIFATWAVGWMWPNHVRSDAIGPEADISDGPMRPDSPLSTSVFPADYFSPPPGQAAIAAAATALNSAWVAPSRA